MKTLERHFSNKIVGKNANRNIKIGLLSHEWRITNDVFI